MFARRRADRGTRAVPQPRNVELLGDSIAGGPDDRVRAYLRYTGVGLQFFVIFLGLVLGGVYLDRRFATDPWFTLAGTAFGGTAAFYSLYKAVYGVGRRRDEGMTKKKG